MVSSGGVAGSVIGILGTYVLIYDEIASNFVSLMGRIGYPNPSYLRVNPTTVTTTTQRLMIFPKLYYDLMNALIPNFIVSIRTGNFTYIISLFSEYLLYLYMPFIVGGALAAILSGGAARSISASLMGVLTSFIILEGISFGLSAPLEFSIDSMVIDLLGVVIIGSLWISIVAGILGALTGRIYGSGEEK